MNLSLSLPVCQHPTWYWNPCCMSLTSEPAILGSALLGEGIDQLCSLVFAICSERSREKVDRFRAHVTPQEIQPRCCCCVHTQPALCGMLHLAFQLHRSNLSALTVLILSRTHNAAYHDRNPKIKEYRAVARMEQTQHQHTSAELWLWQDGKRMRGRS